MKRCEVKTPFHLKATDTIYLPGDFIEVSEEQLAKIQTLGRNMVEVLGDVAADVEPAAEEKPKRTRKPKQQ